MISQAEEDFLLAFSGLLAFVTRADGVVTKDEVDEMERMLARMGLSRAAHALCVGNFMIVQCEGGDPKGLVEELCTMLNGTARVFLLGLLWRIANADWRIAGAEERVLEEIGLALEIDPAIRSQCREGALPAFAPAELEAAGVPAVLARLGGPKDGSVGTDGLGFWSRF